MRGATCRQQRQCPRPARIVAAPALLHEARLPAGASGDALFIFATEDGTIQAWNQTIADPTTAVIVVPNTVPAKKKNKSPVYKGLALAMTNGE